MYSVLLQIKKIKNLDLEKVNIASVLGNRYFNVFSLNPGDNEWKEYVSKHKHAWYLTEEINNKRRKITLHFKPGSIDITLLILDLGYDGLRHYISNTRTMCCVLGQRTVENALEPYALKIIDNKNEQIYQQISTQKTSSVLNLFSDQEDCGTPTFRGLKEKWYQEQQNAEKYQEQQFIGGITIGRGNEAQFQPYSHDLLPYSHDLLPYSHDLFSTRFDNKTVHEEMKPTQSIPKKDFEYSFVVDYSANEKQCVIYEIQSLHSSSIYQGDEKFKPRYDKFFINENNIDVPGVIDYDKCLQRAAMAAFNLPDKFYPKFMLINRQGTLGEQFDKGEINELKSFYEESKRQAVQKREGTRGSANRFYHGNDPDSVCRDLASGCLHVGGMSFEHMIMYGLEKHQSYDYYQRQQNKINKYGNDIGGHKIASKEVFDSRKPTSKSGVYLRDIVFYNPRTTSIRVYKVYKTIIGDMNVTTDNHSGKGFLQDRWYLTNLDPDQTGIKMDKSKQKNPHVWEMYAQVGKWIERICGNLGKNERYKNYGYPEKEFAHPDHSFQNTFFDKDSLAKHCLSEVDLERIIEQLRDKGVSISG
ncbi:hypothetical protein EDC55_10746 [Allofrancisella inopinata]|uniref:Uncharacterized protein n=1 Tax=Allofrancisella inopinata TaxID=1085647 RepID=A0AAE6YHG3_9GAMM|nr:hypothetical protein [Allofrancisella inopinata]QIV95512.1 hypothetical protein E4K63_01125 [Allofrancisella inopinata]TDT72650.1 hypothetical protein EDC55_10746 [Allofrancisella inopinata]